MNENWLQCKNILVIRPDNMGDLIMSGPAIRALKETFTCKITVLTSSMGSVITPYLPEIDNTIVFDLPWVKAKETIGAEAINELVARLKKEQFDAAVIFTVFSQNPLPAAMIAFMAEILLRLGYCRENPYNLLTDWIPDQEPYNFIQHQVERDLALVQSIGANTNELKLLLNVSSTAKQSAINKIKETGVDINKAWIICHAGVSEKKREYPVASWVEASKKLIDEQGLQVLFTGSKGEKDLCDVLASEVGLNSFSIAGLLSIEEFIGLISQAPLIISVNTGTVHIAAAVNTPVIVLYAQTNPQHTPWMVKNKVLEFSVDEESRSKNQVVQHLYKEHYKAAVTIPSADEIVTTVKELLSKENKAAILNFDTFK